VKNYLTYFGNHLIHARLPDSADILYAPPPLPGISRKEFPDVVQRCFENPLGMPPLRALVNGNSKVLIAFDDNCQPFPPTRRPDFRQLAIERLLAMLYSYGVEKRNIRLVCAVALHRKMKPAELEYMVGPRVMREFFPHQLENFDAEDPERIVYLGDTEASEPVYIWRDAVESDLVIYVDTVQIPLNSGHKAVGVGLSGYKTIACHHNPEKTAEIPHVMQPEGSEMHASINRIGRLVEKHCRILLLAAPMNNQIYPFYLDFIGKSPERCNWLERFLRRVTPSTMALLPEPVRRLIMHNIRTAYEPFQVDAGAVEEVHKRTMEGMRRQMAVPVSRQYDILVFGLPDLSPYAVGARINPVLVVSDVLGYLFNWFYERPYVKPGGVVIILNPTYEIFHPEYHVPYRRFYDEVLADTTDPFEMRRRWEEKYAMDPYFIECYRHRYAYHGAHPFTVWYWATYPLKYLSKVILVGPKTDRQARRLGVSWAPNLQEALEMARQAAGGDSVVAMTVPPFFYTTERAVA